MGIGHWLLDTGHWTLVIGHWTLVTGFLTMDTGHCATLVTGHCVMEIPDYIFPHVWAVLGESHQYLQNTKKREEVARLGLVVSLSRES